MSNNKIEEKEHHLYGGSSAKYWSNCYGWASLVQTIPHEEAGEAAQVGTALHTGILEVKTQAEINKRLTGVDFTDEELREQYKGIPLWPEDGESMANEFWDEVWVKALEEFITGKQVYIEKKLMLFSELDCGGTADFIAMYYNDQGKLVAVLGDIKTGRVRVEPDEEQMKFYLTALYKLVKAKGSEIDVFKSFIYQPQHHTAYTDHVFTKAEILRALKKYEKAIIESKKESPKFKAGDWCDWCKCRGRCTTYTKFHNDKFDMAVARIEGKPSLIPVEELSDEIIKNLVLYGDKLKNYLSAVNKEAILRFMSGKPIEGLKIVEGVTKRKFEDTEKTKQAMLTYGINPVKESLLGIGDMTKALQATGLKKKEADAVLEPFVVKPPAPPKITTADDPKPDFVFKSAGSLLDGFDEDGEF